MAANGIDYEDALLVCKAKLTEDGSQCVLDLPFRIYAQEVVCKGKNYGPYPLPKELDGQEVLAAVHYCKKARLDLTDDTAKVAAFAGRITDFQTDPRVKAHYTTTKQTAYATSEKVGEVETKTPYAGADKAELAPFCVSSAVMSKAQVAKIEAGQSIKLEAVAVEEPKEEPKEEVLEP